MLSVKHKPQTTLGISTEQITQIAGNAATYDLRGNLTAYEINGKDYSLEYDLDNRITKVTVDNDEVEYRYDAFGRRIIRQEGNTKSALIWWGNSECAEHKHRAGTAGEPKRAQAHPVIQNDIMSHPSRLNSVIARAVEGSKFKLQWYHKNYLDHVYAVSDKSGNILEHYRYTAFGEVTIYNDNGQLLNQSAIDNTIMWNTRRKDEVSGYYMYKYRHYAPELGRWPSRDPIEENGGVNLYAFVGNDGVNKWDKLGKMPLWQLGCCCVCAAIWAKEIIDGVLGKVCAGKVGADFWSCHINNAIAGILKRAGITALQTCIARATSAKDIGTCLKAHGIAALVDLAKFASCICCAGPIRVTLGIVIPAVA